MDGRYDLAATDPELVHILFIDAPIYSCTCAVADP